MKNNLVNNIWKSPGGSRTFDTKILEWEEGQASSRSILSLKYIKDNPNCTLKDFKNEIWGFISKSGSFFNILDPKHSMTKHIVSQLTFWKLLDNNNDILSLSISGEKLLESINKKDGDKCNKIIINNLLKIQYPCDEVKTFGINVSPFNIIFNYIETNGQLSKMILENEIIFLKNNKLEKYKTEENKGNFTSWQIESLVSLGILENNNRTYSFSEKDKEFITDNLVFSYDFTQYKLLKKQYHYKRNNTDSTLRKYVLDKSSGDCFFDNRHKTFETEKYDNFLECHHILPRGNQIYFDFDLDTLENIVAICPNCHREIHLSKNNENLISLLEKTNSFKKYFGLKKGDLKKYY